MRKLIAIGMLVLTFGCSKSATEHYRLETLEWDDSGMFNEQKLFIGYDGRQVVTNVASLDEAATIAGQYGWRLVNAEHFANRGLNVAAYHMEYRGTKATSLDMTPQIVKRLNEIRR